MLSGPRAVVVLVIAADMRRLQPLHPAAQVAIVAWPEHQMKMIGHQTISQHPHRIAGIGFVKQANKRGIIGRLMKHHLPAVPTVENVITIAAERNAFGPGRDRAGYRNAASASIIRPDPFCLPRYSTLHGIAPWGLGFAAATW